MVLSDEVLGAIFTSTETQGKEFKDLSDGLTVDHVDQRSKVLEKVRNDLWICDVFGDGVERAQFHNVLQYIKDLLHLSIPELERIQAYLYLFDDLEEFKLRQTCLLTALNGSCEVFEDL